MYISLVGYEVCYPLLGPKWQILPNSAGQFAKFCSSPWQNCLNFVAYHGRPS